MGIIYNSKNGWHIEARIKSIGIFKDVYCIEVDYEDLDSLEIAVKKAQEVRRDKKEKL